MYFFYNFILIILIIILAPAWITALMLVKKFRAGFFQKCGFLDSFIKQRLSNYNIKPVWFHAVSVGECLAIVDLVKKFNSTYPNIPIVISTVTLTGQHIAIKQLGNIATIIYFPFDIGFIVNKVIDIINPQVVMIVETEIWPNFSFLLSRKKIPLVLINGRLSPKSFKNYYRLRLFTSIILSFYSKFLMQSEADADRLIKIGAKKEKVEVIGNIKYDIIQKMTNNDIMQLRNELCIGDNDKIIIAGSTHSSEEAMLISVYKELNRKIDNLKLIVVPRHPERYNEVIALLDEAGFKFGCRSKGNTFEDASILLLDTMGELSKFYSISTIAFVGGSIIPKGGHNPLEPAAYRVPIIMGEHIFNFNDICNYMIDKKALILIKNNVDLASILLTILTDIQLYKQMQDACDKIFESNRGATDLIISYLEKITKNGIHNS